MTKLVFLNNLKKSLRTKQMLLDGALLNEKNETLHLAANIFYRYKKIRKYTKKKKIKLVKNKNLKFTSFFKVILNTNYFIKLKTLNPLVNIRKMLIFFKLSRRFKNTIFSRRPDLFSDFLNLNALFTENKIHPETWLLVIGQIFNLLLKKKHGQFFLLIKLLFKQLTLHEDEYKYFSAIQGLKLIINGKLKGKTRARTIKIITGRVPCNNFSLKIKFNKLQVYNRYGAYGLNFWLNTRKNETTKRK